jgi:hypothetical protein
MIALHVGGASATSVLVSVVVIFFLVFAFSFAFGDIPSGESRFSREWLRAWGRVTLPRLIAAGLFSAALFAGSSMFGNDGGDGAANAAACDGPQAPLTGEAVTDARILLASESMAEIADAAASGDVSGAQALFYSLDAHNLSHDIDAPLRAADPDLARALCQRVVVLENQMAGILDAKVIEREARAIAGTMGDARAVLAAQPSPTGAVQAFDPCALPVGAVTSDPLTPARLATVADIYTSVAEDAATAPIEELRVRFGGDAHNLSHDIDGPLRRADADLALDLCHSVLALESEFAGEADRAVIAAEAATTAGIIADAGVALGITER